MTSLPSYEEATAKRDWLQVAAPYVREADYRSLLLVSLRFWRVFAPLLWKNLFQSVRLAGLDPSDDITWWFDFVFNKLHAVRPAARALVRVLDARHFATDSYHFATDQDERTLQTSFSKALSLLPNVTFVMIDKHPDLNINFLIGHRSDAGVQSQPPLLLSIAGTPYRLSDNFFSASIFRELVYLDVSGVPGSARPLLQYGLLPNLRVLKLRDRELDDETFAALVSSLGTRLWSLDVSGNRLSDGALEIMQDKCFPRTILRSTAYFYTEGRLKAQTGGSDDYGPFVTIDESQWSRNFSHPERYLVDSPVYLADGLESQLEHGQILRNDGRAISRRDDARWITNVLCHQSQDFSGEEIRTSTGLTHLHLSGNLISAGGLEKLMRVSNGQLQYVACDMLSLVSPATALRYWPDMTHVQGVIGATDFFRPVFASNLQSMRIHHSFVTGVLSLRSAGLSQLACVYLAETLLLQRVEDLYGQGFIPDMNPRLVSIVLTCIPRRSSGPLTERLIRFLRLLSEQEREVQDTAESFRQARRRPGLLRGLRHVRLEFEPDTMEEGFSAEEDLDAEHLMSSGDRGFSFFADEHYEKPTTRVRHGIQSVASADTSDAKNGGELHDNHETEYIVHKSYWNGEPVECQVWVGPKSVVPGSAKHAYRRLVMGPESMRDGVGPASPAQIRAGAPQGCFIFHTAWRLSVMPGTLVAPERNYLAGMQDVLGELKAYRLEGRRKFFEQQQRGNLNLGAPHYFWTGKLDVSTQAPMPQASASQYWR